ncbi:unnamed protein product [Oppiella nova]|uniref:Uncharacterized protein n=1 Tax=Oppiella nova TaxID=334625 RepID=A0A7R9LF31_9ACAR|nr:unnamed protein product [Oppiella nova]CAG2162230.1 unnamed protein product [Oppiella nova]
MSQDLARGDSNQVKTSITDLRHHKKALTQELNQIVDKSRDLQRRLDERRLKTSQLMDTSHSLDQLLYSLKSESKTLEDRTTRLETEIAESRDCVQRLKQQLIDKRVDQSMAIDHMNSEVDQLCRLFTNLTKINIERHLSGDHKKTMNASIDPKLAAMDAYLNQTRNKRDMMMQELSNLLMDSSVGKETQMSDESDGNDSDWPIEHRFLSLQIFRDENRVLSERIQFLKTLD